MLRYFSCMNLLLFMSKNFKNDVSMYKKISTLSISNFMFLLYSRTTVKKKKTRCSGLYFFHSMSKNWDEDIYIVHFCFAGQRIPGISQLSQFYIPLS